MSLMTMMRRPQTRCGQAAALLPQFALCASVRRDGQVISAAASSASADAPVAARATVPLAAAYASLGLVGHRACASASFAHAAVERSPALLALGSAQAARGMGCATARVGRACARVTGAARTVPLRSAETSAARTVCAWPTLHIRTRHRAVTAPAAGSVATAPGTAAHRVVGNAHSLKQQQQQQQRRRSDCPRCTRSRTPLLEHSSRTDRRCPRSCTLAAVRTVRAWPVFATAPAAGRTALLAAFATRRSAAPAVMRDTSSASMDNASARKAGAASTVSLRRARVAAAVRNAARALRGRVYARMGGSVRAAVGSRAAGGGSGLYRMRTSRRGKRARARVVVVVCARIAYAPRRTAVNSAAGLDARTTVASAACAIVADATAVLPSRGHRAEGRRRRWWRQPSEMKPPRPRPQQQHRATSSCGCVSSAPRVAAT